MHGEVGVTLAGPELGVRQLAVAHAARVLLAERQRAERLRQQRQPLHADGDLARLRLEQRTLDADQVAEGKQAEQLVRVGTELVLLEVELDPARLIGEVRERRLAVGAQRHEPPGEPVQRRVPLAESLERRSGGPGAIEAIGERRYAPLHELRELLAPRRLRSEERRVGKEGGSRWRR